MRVLLINMPWASIDVPSISLGILKKSVNQRLPDVDVTVLHANLDFVDWVTEATEFDLADYHYYSLSSYFLGCGDWVFSSALYKDPLWRVREFTERHEHSMSSEHLNTTLNLHRLAPNFVAWMAERIVSLKADVVGFTSTFQQNAASLSAARHIKELAPETAIIFGGANCDGEQGAALHRNFNFVDYVVRGEGEVAFPALIQSLQSGQGKESIPGLCWRDSNNGSTANAMSRSPLPAARIVSPDYDGYFERLEVSTAHDWVEPRLVIEGARGCWWGEKHHCTFCGLNGSFMDFRSKSPEVFHQEIRDLVERHKVLDLFLVDNILDMKYVSSLVPRIAESGIDLRMQVEIKSNMRFQQLEALTKAGILGVQPGIESLNSRVLEIMDKGVSGCRNVRMLRDGESLGMTVLWNYLYGFPGEAESDYVGVMHQLPALHHLSPPESSARIAIERFSPYFNRPELGFSELRPDGQYAMTYDLPEEELYAFAYIFDAPHRGIDGSVVARLEEALSVWQSVYKASRLVQYDLGESVILSSERPAFDWSVIVITDEMELAAFRLLDEPRTVESLVGKIAGSGISVDEETVTDLLRHWHSLGLIFEENDYFVQLATKGENQQLARIDCRFAD